MGCRGPELGALALLQNQLQVGHWTRFAEFVANGFVSVHSARSVRTQIEQFGSEVGLSAFTR